jgi:phenylacetate-CoA ligase
METPPVEAIKALQFEKTKETLERAYHKSSFYRDLFDKARVKPERFKKLEDIARFPFIDKQDLVKDQKENTPYGRRVCLPHDQIRRFNVTSGTSGMGKEVHCHEENSIRAANASTASHFAAIGLKKGDVSALLGGESCKSANCSRGSIGGSFTCNMGGGILRRKVQSLPSAGSGNRTATC